MFDLLGRLIEGGIGWFGITGYFVGRGVASASVDWRSFLRLGNKRHSDFEFREAIIHKT